MIPGKVQIDKNPGKYRAKPPASTPQETPAPPGLGMGHSLHSASAPASTSLLTPEPGALPREGRQQDREGEGPSHQLEGKRKDCLGSDRKQQIRSQDDEEPVTQGHSTTLLVYRALPGDVFPRHPPPPPPHTSPQRESQERRRSARWGPHCLLQPGLLHSGVALWLPLVAQGLRRKRLGLKSDLPGLVWFHFASLEIGVLS